MTICETSSIPGQPKSQHPAVAEVRACSLQWIAHFNRGDVDRCVAAYAPDAVMVATPFGTYHGTDQIDDFWRPLVASGAEQLEYDNTVLRLVDSRTVLLTADWSMNIGSGVITEELWVKQDDGRWLLQRDAFELQRRAPNAANDAAK